MRNPKPGECPDFRKHRDRKGGTTGKSGKGSQCFTGLEQNIKTGFAEHAGKLGGKGEKPGQSWSKLNPVKVGKRGKRSSRFMGKRGKRGAGKKVVAD